MGNNIEKRDSRKSLLLLPELAQQRLQLMHANNQYLRDIYRYPPFFDYKATFSFKRIITNYFKKLPRFSINHTPVEFTLHLADLTSVINEHVFPYKLAISYIVKAAAQYSLREKYNLHALIGFGAAYIRRVSNPDNKFETEAINRFIQHYQNEAAILDKMNPTSHVLDSFVNGYTHMDAALANNDPGRFDLHKAWLIFRLGD